MSRICIVGGPGCGKSTLAQELRRKLGLATVLCSDTLEQAQETGRAQLDGVLYAPRGMGWSQVSAWISEGWLNRPGPWVLEGVAVIRALRKWHAAHPDELPPCDQLIWCREPHIDLEPGQLAMLSGHDTILCGLSGEWPELFELLDVRE